MSKSSLAILLVLVAVSFACSAIAVMSGRSFPKETTPERTTTFHPDAIRAIEQAAHVLKPVVYWRWPRS